MVQDIILNKRMTITRCIDRIHEEYAGNLANLANITKQDSIILNLQRACEAAIDLAMHFVAVRGIGLPQTSRDAFDLLQGAGILNVEVAHRMKAMVGFRNIAVHDYRSIQLPILQSILDSHLDDFHAFIRQITQP